MPPETVRAVLERIRRGDMVLPAIQREFVWGEAKICALFDSLMRSYPIGGFLAWRIDRQRSHEYTHYGFLRRYHERDSKHCSVLDRQDDRELVAVLDGQQRLTSLFIGLFGSCATRKKYQRSSKDDSYPERFLHLDLLARPDEEDGWEYRFAFLTLAQAEAESARPGCSWFRVGEITDPAEFTEQGWAGALFKRTNSIEDADARDLAFQRLETLWKTYSINPLISFHEERDQPLDRVLDIFVRVNSGGETLSKADLLMSIATAQWQHRDARAEITRTVEDLNGIGRGFSVRRDLVLKSGLMCCGVADVGFKVANFTSENMTKLEQKWEEVTKALDVAVRLVASFGFDARRLTADSPLIVIAYYVHRRSLGSDYVTAAGHRVDRELIRQWLVRSLLRQGVWGSGLDTTLRRLRKAIDDHGAGGFPIEAINAVFRDRGRPLSFDPADVELLLDTEYGSPRAFAILSLLDTGADVRDAWDVDHIVPRSWFSPKRTAEAGLSSAQAETLRAMSNRLPNLQLLRSNDNQSKQDTSPRGWFELQFPNPDDRARALASLLIDEVPDTVTEFAPFYEARSDKMGRRLADILGLDEAKYDSGNLAPLTDDDLVIGKPDVIDAAISDEVSPQALRAMLRTLPEDPSAVQ